MIFRKQIIIILAFTSILSSCNAPTERHSLAIDKANPSNVQSKDNKKNKEKIDFPHNEKIIFHIGISTNPPKVQEDKIYSAGWKYRVSVENITDIDREKYRKISLETWLQLLEDERTDWSVNLILYDIYQRDAAMLARRDDKNKWREHMKEEDIAYWKETLEVR